MLKFLGETLAFAMTPRGLLCMAAGAIIGYVGIRIERALGIR